MGLTVSIGGNFSIYCHYETFEFSSKWLKFVFSVKFLKIRRVFFYQSCINVIKISFFEAFHALKLIIMRCFTQVLIPGHTSPLVYVTGMIFDSLNKLNASCRHMASQMFFAIVVNLALNAPSCKWLKPKYCSTI